MLKLQRAINYLILSILLSDIFDNPQKFLDAQCSLINYHLHEVNRLREKLNNNQHTATHLVYRAKRIHSIICLFVSNLLFSNI